MGTHGRRGLTEWWLGSVAEGVRRRVTTPLIIVQPQEGSDETASLMQTPVNPPDHVKPLLACARDLTRAARGA
jgi:hypothetical protein